MSAKALLIGSSFSAAPMLQRLRARGLTVAVCGSLPADPCHQYADESHFVNYADRDALLDLVQRERFDFLVPSCNDTSYMSGAWVASQTGHPGFDAFETAQVLHTKDRFRLACGQLGLPVPRALTVLPGIAPNIPADWFPVLVKPVDSFSGRGMTKVHDVTGLPQALADACKASQGTSVVVEEFVDGNLHSHSAFVVDGKLGMDFFVDEFCTVYPYQVDCSNHPSLLPDTVRELVRQDMQALIQGMGLCNGLLHTQFIAQGNRHWIIEPMRRCPGDLYTSLIERSTGIDYTDRFVAGFLGEAAQQPKHSPTPRLMGRHTISVGTPRVAHAWSSRLPGSLESVVPLKESGLPLAAAPYDKLAILFNEFDSLDQMRTVTPEMSRHIDIETLQSEQELL